MLDITSIFIVFGILVFYGSAAVIAVGSIFENRHDIRFSQWLAIIAAAVVWPITLIFVVMFTMMDMDLELGSQARRKS